jgi:hypothetical protein
VGSYTEGKSAAELIDMIETGAAAPGSAVGQAVLAAVQVRVADMQREAAADAVTWAKWTALGTCAAAVIALVALLIAVL